MEGHFLHLLGELLSINLLLVALAVLLGGDSSPVSIHNDCVFGVMGHLLISSCGKVESIEFICELIPIFLKRRIHMFHKLGCTYSLLILLKIHQIPLISNTENSRTIIRQVSKHHKHNKLWLFRMNYYVVN